jgi:myotubularin-related protein 6/7/8
MISYCTYRPSPPASHHPPSIRLRCRDFTFLAFNFLTDKEARAVYDGIRSCTCRLGSLEKLLAFSYHSVPREKKYHGWSLYDPKKEFARQGISPKSSEKGWRFTEINKDYSVSISTSTINGILVASISNGGRLRWFRCCLGSQSSSTSSQS